MKNILNSIYYPSLINEGSYMLPMKECLIALSRYGVFNLHYAGYMDWFGSLISNNEDGSRLELFNCHMESPHASSTDLLKKAIQFHGFMA